MDTLTKKYPSRPFNPDLANILFRAGYIESWDRGTLEMLNECRTHHLPALHCEFEAGGFQVEFVRYTTDYLQSQGLRAELAAIFLQVQQHGVINNSIVQ